MKNINIGTRLGLGFAIIIVFLCALGWFGAKKLSKTSDLIRTAVEERYAQVALAEEISRSVHQQITLLQLSVLSAHDSNEVLRYARAYDEGVRNNSTMFEKLKALVKTPEDEKYYSKIVAARQEFGARRKKVFDLILQNKSEEAREFLLRNVQSSQGKLADEIRALVDYQSSFLHQGSKEAIRTAEESVWIIAEVASITVVLALIISVFTTRSITSPIKNAVAIANRVTAGDLTSKIEITTGGELGQLLSALDKMNKSLASIVDAVRNGSNNVAFSAEQIAIRNVELSRRTEEQAASLEEAAASMEEFSSILQNNVGIMQDANKLATAATGLASRGSSVTADVMKTMEQITISSRKIGEITGVINSIAFQTNILALNAAVEAARAGEQGRGFAVVASEVRALAQRSSTAAKEIETLIQECVRSIELGSEKVTEASKTVTDVSSQIQDVNTLITEISSAAKEQAIGINQVGDVVSQLDKVTQQNATLVDESATAAAALNQHADKLVELVRIFKTGDVGPFSSHNFAAHGPDMLSYSAQP